MPTPPFGAGSDDDDADVMLAELPGKTAITYKIPSEIRRPVENVRYTDFDLLLYTYYFVAIFHVESSLP